MSITEAVRRLFAGSPIERATVDLAQVATEVKPIDPPLGIREPKAYRPRDLTPGQLAKLRKLSPAFAHAEARAKANTREIAAQRRRHKLDEIA